MIRFWKRKWIALVMRWEVDRHIPVSYDWYMTDNERVLWQTHGWRVTYWVCPKCGTRLSDKNAPWQGNRNRPPTHGC